VAEERTLTQRELNRALLARQLLLERARTPLPRALERIGGIQAQYAPAMYIGLWSRLDGFERDALTRALQRRSVVQGTLLRATIHLVSARDYWPFAVAVRRARRESWAGTPYRKEVSVRALAAAARGIRRRFAGREFSRKELDEALSGRKPRVSVWRNGVSLWLDLVRVPPSGTWERRSADLYALAEDWLGPENATEAKRIELLVRRYLAGFGPASPGEIANWAGLTPKAVERAARPLKLRRFRAEDGSELIDLPRAPLPSPDTPAPVRFLPVWDATLLAHARRTQILPEEHRSRVFSVKTPQSVNTFLVDGAVAGAWRYERGSVRLEPFRSLDRSVRRELDEEAERLAALHE
jgi:Winged helix DNA-binding domain